MNIIKSSISILTITAAVAMQAQAQSFPTNGLVAYYPFDGNANDDSGNGHNGVLNGTTMSPTNNQANVPDGALHFGGNSYVSVTPTPFNVNSNWTISMWCFLDRASGALTFLSTGQDSSSGLNLRYVSYKPLTWQLVVDYSPNNTNVSAGSTNGYSEVDCAATNNPTSWNMLTVVKNGSFYEMFLDSVLVASNTIVGTTADTGKLWFGEHQAGCCPYNLIGSLSDICIYNRPLSSAEVQDLYQYEAGPQPPSLVLEPQSVTVSAHSNAIFSAVAAGTAPLSFQWSFDGTNIAGATTNSFEIADVVQSDLGAYALAITNPYGSVTSSNALLSMYPFLAVPFSGLDTDWGDTNTLSVTAWGTGPLSYQWFDNGVAIADATNQTLTFSDIQFTNAGLYSVVVSSALGSVTNPPAQVVVNPSGVSLGLSPTITISGVVGKNYVIQRTAALNNTNPWATVANVTLTQPVQIWVDTNTDASLPSNPQRFYQVLPGQ